MRNKKKFDFAEGKYYFNVSNGIQSITIHRAEQKTALDVFSNYEKVGKKVEWLGKWNGKKFEDDREVAKAK